MGKAASTTQRASPVFKEADLNSLLRKAAPSAALDDLLSGIGGFAGGSLRGRLAAGARLHGRCERLSELLTAGRGIICYSLMIKFNRRRRFTFASSFSCRCRCLCLSDSCAASPSLCEQWLLSGSGAAESESEPKPERQKQQARSSYFCAAAAAVLASMWWPIQDPPADWPPGGAAI